MSRLPITYVLPIRRQHVDEGPTTELRDYLADLAADEKIVVDGSPPAVFAYHHERWSPVAVHIAVDSDIGAKNGKAAGVLTGMRRGSHEAVIIADDDVRYDAGNLQRILRLLDGAEIVRPQNYFAPLVWHAMLDTARTLLNRALDGDWPGTLAVRRSAYQQAGGYDGDVLFENLELVRTIRASGGRERVAFDLYVARRPPTAAHFLRQRIRQAYDEFARPVRMAVALSILPLAAAAVATGRKPALWIAALVSFALAERGRRRQGGAAVFPAGAVMLAPVWLIERGICSWLAVGCRFRYGGVRYGTTVLTRAANPTRALKNRLRARAAGTRQFAAP